VAGTMSRCREWLRVPSPNANAFSNDHCNREENRAGRLSYSTHRI
jgi:hypothetical protein